MRFTAVERVNLYLQFAFLLSAVRFFFTELLNVEAKMFMITFASSDLTNEFFCIGYSETKSACSAC